MKKIIALLMTMALMMVLTSCGKESAKAEKYCWSCGEAIAKEVAFCSYCGAEVQGNQEVSETTLTTGPSANQKTNTTKKTATKGAPTATQVFPHTHSYSKEVVAATCTENGYTIYTCVCGYTYKDNYTNASHSYTKFICDSCGTIDQANAYKHLVEYVKSNGKASGSSMMLTINVFNDKEFILSYNVQDDILWASCSAIDETSTITTLLSVNDGFYWQEYTYNRTGEKCTLSGFIDPKTFNENSALTYDKYTGFDSGLTAMLDVARAGLAWTIFEMEQYFNEHGVGLSVHALGYMGVL
ncbi:MAG: zinc ribbon domain-containing protein [Clostridia bacterium]|nr:zinc ribbon domain-containing protein [Clostridia bacterium]